jgi:uncharacterized ubiquitin-like protein YukD
MILRINDRLTGETYELEVSEETTAEEVIDMLIEEGLIVPAPGVGYEWMLLDSRFIMISPDERITSRVSSSGKNEVYLCARWYMGYVPTYMMNLEYPIIVSPLPKPKNPVIINDRLSCRRYLLEVFWEDTAEDVIRALINAGLIKHKLDASCELVLVNNGCFTMNHYERVIPRLSSSGKNEVYLDVKRRRILRPYPPCPPKKFKCPIIIDPPLKPKHMVIVNNKLNGEKYELEIFEGNTARDVIDALMEGHLIGWSPNALEGGYEWILLDSRLDIIYPDEEMLFRISKVGSNDVYLDAKQMSPSWKKDRYPLPIIISPNPSWKLPSEILIVNDMLSRKRYKIEVFWGNTAEDVIDALIEEGLIKEGYEWVLLDSKYAEIDPHEEILPIVFSSGEDEVYEVYLDAKPIHLPSKRRPPIVISPLPKPKNTVIVNNKLNGEKYELGVFRKNTAKDVIDALINAGLIEGTPREGYTWTLIDSRSNEIASDERILSRLSSSGGNEVYLDARFSSSSPPFSYKDSEIGEAD